MSDSEEERFCYYGNSLDPYDEDSFPKKRPISIEEQVARDAQGRRRFHGAFTGGFSAGFFNSVGSLEGWAPQEFKSSRNEKAAMKIQKPEDYMDDEDVGEFGIAPQSVRATDEFANKKKRKKQVFSDGPIPGEPVLQTLLNSGNETIGYLLLKNMSLKHRNKEDWKNDTETEPNTKVYGCEMPKLSKVQKALESTELFIPKIYKEYLTQPKGNTFGMGYEGLTKSHLNLFESSNLIVKERSNKKLSIAGQAFGVGAFEDEDEDIYVKDNMNRYDFELTSESAAKKSNKNNKGEQTVLEMFVRSKTPLTCFDYHAPPAVPHSFTGKHNVRRSRFEPISKEVKVERREMNAEIRAKYLGETFPSKNTSEDTLKVNEKNTHTEREKVVQTASSNDNSLAGFSELLFDKFVSAGHEENQNILEPVKKIETEHGTKEMRDAAKLKMFGPLTRITFDWQPCSLLCKRFNVPEPFSDKSSTKAKKRTKNLIFEYQKESDCDSLLKSGLSVQKFKETIVDLSENQSMEVNDNSIPLRTATEGSTTNTEIEKEIKRENIAENQTPLDITDKVDVSKNIALFAAVFLSSSESEEEEDQDYKKEENSDTRNIELKTNVLTDQLIPKIRPGKVGILSNVQFDKLQSGVPSNEGYGSSMEQKVNNITENSVTVAKSTAKVENFTYGPKLPEIIAPKVDTSMSFDKDEDEWIEKNEDERRKHSHKKKSKKHKHKKRK